MKVLAITPARGGSKRIPHKNIAPVAGKPLIQWTIDEAKRSKFINVYLISTDDACIAETCLLHNEMMEAPFAKVVRRPADLAQDNSPTIKALQHAVTSWEEWEKAQGGFEPYDIIVHLPCTNPLKTAADIDGAIQKLIDTGADSVIGMARVLDAHPCRLKHLRGEQIVDFLPEPAHGQSQLYEPHAYIRNGSVYVLTREACMGPDARLFGHAKSLAWVMNPGGVNIDEPADLYAAEYLLKERMKCP